MKKVFSLLFLCFSFSSLSLQLNAMSKAEIATKLKKIENTFEQQLAEDQKYQTFKIMLTEMPEEASEQKLIVAEANLKQLIERYKTTQSSKLKKTIIYVVIGIISTILIAYGLDITLMLLTKIGMPTKLVGYAFGTMSRMTWSGIRLSFWWSVTTSTNIFYSIGHYLKSFFVSNHPELQRVAKTPIRRCLPEIRPENKWLCSGLLHDPPPILKRFLDDPMPKCHKDITPDTCKLALEYCIEEKCQ